MEDRLEKARGLTREGHHGVQARIRRLREGEAPASGAVDDRRMVEYFKGAGDTALIDLIGSSLYQPLQERELLTTVMHLFGREQSPSDDEVVAFYRRYGPLGGAAVSTNEGVFPAWAARLRPADREQLPMEVSRFACEPLWWVREQARELRLTYDLYLGLRDNDLPSLRRLLGGVPAGKQIADIYIVEGQLFRDVVDEKGPPSAEGGPASGREPAGLEPMSGKDCRLWAAALVARQLSKAEARVTRTWQVSWSIDAPPRSPEFDSGGEDLVVVRIVDCHDLMAPIYLQLGELVQQRAVLRQCPGCSRLFYPGRANKQYCSAACGDATRQRTYYRRPGRTRKPASGEPES